MSKYHIVQLVNYTSIKLGTSPMHPFQRKSVHMRYLDDKCVWSSKFSCWWWWCLLRASKTYQSQGRKFLMLIVLYIFTLSIQFILKTWIRYNLRKWNMMTKFFLITIYYCVLIFFKIGWNLTYKVVNKYVNAIKI